MPTHREFRFVKVPDGMPSEECFELVEATMPEPGAGQVLVKTHYLSIDPYFRNAMTGATRYGTLKPGMTMIGRGAGVVTESRHPDFAPGDAVQSEFGWRENVVLDGDGLRKLAPDLQPISLSLGIVGQSAATAFVGLYELAGIKKGDTVVVSAAAGAVGSAVGQIAQIEGCKVVGIAGGPEKCRYVVDELGFDDCIDYKAGPIGPGLAKAVPEGVDIYFDNVGGAILEDVLDHCNDFARIPVCGQISQYNSDEWHGLRNFNLVLNKVLTIRGLRIGAHLPRRDEALEILLGWWREGRLRYRETVSEGFESAPRAFINMLSGGNVGKQVVKVV